MKCGDPQDFSCSHKDQVTGGDTIHILWAQVFAWPHAGLKCILELPLLLPNHHHFSKWQWHGHLK